MTEDMAMPHDLPKVSCVIPSYRRSDTVTRAIDSVLAQTYPNMEVCVVDDNYPGDAFSRQLRQLLERYRHDARVRCIQQEKHVNGAVARNVGIRAAQGEFIAFLDDDDEWLPEKTCRQMEIFFNHPSTDAVTTLWTRYVQGKAVMRCPVYSTDDFQYKVFAREISVFSSTVLIRKSAIDKFGGFDESLVRHQDLQFLVHAARDGSFEVVPEYLVKLHADSTANQLDPARFVEAKSAFFRSVKSELDKYPPPRRRNIENAHRFEILLFALRAKNFFLAIKYLWKIGPDIPAYAALFRRIKDRKRREST